MTPRYARLLTKLYLTLVAYMVAFRLLNVMLVKKQMGDVAFTDFLQAFWLGWRFDNVIICAILTIPFILFTLNHFVFQNEKFQKWALLPVYVLLPIVLTLQITDTFSSAPLGPRPPAAPLTRFASGCSSWESAGVSRSNLRYVRAWPTSLQIRRLTNWP
mgnify:CR=1 FL=1